MRFIACRGRKGWHTHATQCRCHWQVCSAWSPEKVRQRSGGSSSPDSSGGRQGFGNLISPLKGTPVEKGLSFSTMGRQGSLLPESSSFFCLCSHLPPFGTVWVCCWTGWEYGWANAGFRSGGWKTGGQCCGGSRPQCGFSRYQTLPTAQDQPREPDSFLLCWA